MIARVIGVAAGIWLMFAPAVLGYGDPAAANDRIFGPIVGSLAFIAIWEVARPLRWGTLPFGMWLLLAPFVLGYQDLGAVVSSVIAGVLIVSSALVPGRINERHGGGWRTLLPDRAVPEEGEAA